MNTQQQGSIGELKVAADLMEKGYFVFTEISNNSRIDIIAMKDNKLTRIQVKAYNEKNGFVEVRSGKRGLKDYKYEYEKDDFDLVALYVPNRDVICYIKWSAISEGYGATIRFEAPKKVNPKLTYRMFEDYLEIE